MRARLFHHWPALLLSIAALAALGLLWLARDTPLPLAPGVQFDALSAFFLLLLCGGLALAAWETPGDSRRALVAAPLAALGLGATLLPLIVLAFALLSALAAVAGRAAPPAEAPRRFARLGAASERLLLAAPLPLAALALAIGFGALALRGTLAYDQRTAGAALDSFAFWFVLLAAAVPIGSLALPPAATPVGVVLRLAWLYPLVRLYSLGPWNTGWSLAAALFGGALGAWAAVAALTKGGDGWPLPVMAWAGLALAGFGLSSSAGLAAGCYALLVCLLLNALPAAESPDRPAYLGWLLSPALPIAAPFVAGWMLIGAAVAGGLVALAGAAWVVALLGALAAVLGAGGALGRRPRWRAAASVALGVGAPLAVVLLIQPTIAQLQGGMTPFGDVTIWPWVGLATLDSGKAQTAVLPSVAVAALMLVLLALAYLIARYAGSGPRGADDGAALTDERRDELLALLLREVPWLGGDDEGPASDAR